MHQSKNVCDGQTLGAAGIGRDHTVQWLPKMVGGASGGIKFVDVSQGQDGVTRIKFQRPGAVPAWRRNVEPGMCLEGVCTNEDCEAYEEMVIMPLGMGWCDIVLGMNGEKNCCPICSKFVQPKTIAFNNCRYKLSRYKGHAQQTRRTSFVCATLSH
jgi:hypothetical protein